MKKIINSTIYIGIALMIAFTSFSGNAFALFFSELHINANFSIGSLNVGIDKLQISDNRIVWSDENDNIHDGVLRINTSDSVTFSLVNYSNYDVNYTLNMQLAFDYELTESGTILLYPYEYSDMQIIQNLNRGNYGGAVIGFKAFDDTQILLSSGYQNGINLDIASGMLQKNSQMDFSYKLFFYGDHEVTENPSLYHNKQLEVIVTALSQSTDNAWSSKNIQSFTVTSVMDLLYPIIDEIPQNKTFLLTQAGNIDLKSYAVASDMIEGNISHKIVITSEPEFNPNKAGVYIITYNVTSNSGKAAAPLKIKITIIDE